MNKVITLSDGTEVECYSVPPYMIIDAQRKVGIIQPQEPVQKVKSAAGHIEEFPYDEDSDDPVWIQYKEELAVFENASVNFCNGFMWDAGVARWRKSGSKKWETDPPKDYELPRPLQRLELYHPCVDGRRVGYIKYELVREPSDNSKILRFLYEGDSLSSSEVDGAIESFQD